MEESDLTFVPALYKPPALLPIAKYRENLLYSIERFPQCIIIGQTGSGKTTQLPQYLDQAGWCANGQVIAVTQPRRVAAVTVATRVAEEIRCNVGEHVGYSIRFEDKTSEKTRIKFLTDGLLLREVLMDPLLSRYSVIIVDEAHERSLSTDILLGVLRKIKKQRTELRIVVSSATLQAEELSAFFTSTADKNDQCSILSIEGRTYPVDILYLEDSTDEYVLKAIEVVFDIHQTESRGDILVFFSGREEIMTAIQLVSERIAGLRAEAQAILPVPLYAGLSAEEQMYVFEPAPERTRKVIFATNIAEASVTIGGIVYVVDSGYAKVRAYDPGTGIDTLTVVPISKASAGQRAGRAGRNQAGKCFRLYTEASFQRLSDAALPEIQRSNLAPVILQMKALGIDNIARFKFLTPPPSILVTRALELLFALGALDDYAKLTKPLGMRMAEMSVEPMMAKALLSAPSFGCAREMVGIAAMMSLQGSVWSHHDHQRKAMEASRRKFAAEEGDHLTLLNVYQAFITRGQREQRWCHDNHLDHKSLLRAVSVANQLERMLTRFGISVKEATSANGVSARGSNDETSTRIRKCLTAGFFAQAAKMQPDGSFESVGNRQTMYAHPTSLMFKRQADYVIFHELLETSNKIFVRNISKIERAWLLEYGAGYYQVRS